MRPDTAEDWPGPREIVERLQSIETRMEHSRWVIGVVVVPVLLALGAAVTAVIVAFVT